MSSLDEKLEAALESRRRRNILRRLPSPTRSCASSQKHDEVQKTDSDLVDFVSNDYLSLTTYPPLRTHLLSSLHSSPTTILGSGGSRLLVNPSIHDALEKRLKRFFGAQEALLFNSGFDANVSFFGCVPQVGDVVVYDEFVHASVHDGLRSSRLARDSASFEGGTNEGCRGGGEKAFIPFTHNSSDALRTTLQSLLSPSSKYSPFLISGKSSIFIAVEALYSMDGTLAPLPLFTSIISELFPRGNAHLVVDEAHSTGLFGPLGRGLVAHYGLEDRVFARLHTFGKALGSSGAVILTSPLVKEYLLNYARPLIYTTALSCANVVAINCSFDLLEDGTTTKLAKTLQHLIQYTLTLLRQRLSQFPPTLIALPPHLSCTPSSMSSLGLFSPVIPILTPTPRPLSGRLRKLGLNARPISWPTVPKGKDRVRVCLHAGNTREEVERLVEGVVSWAQEEVQLTTLSTKSVDGCVQAKL